MESKEQFVGSFVARLVEWSQVVKPPQSRTIIPKTIDRLIAPIVLSKDDQKQKSGLVTIAFSTSLSHQPSFQFSPGKGPPRKLNYAIFEILTVYHSGPSPCPRSSTSQKGSYKCCHGGQHCNTSTSVGWLIYRGCSCP